MADSELSKERTKRIAQLFDGLPTDFAGRYEAIQDIRKEFYDGMARTLEPTLNDHLKTVALVSSEDYRKAAVTVNAWLRACGLCATCPQTGRPAILIACSVNGRQKERMKFQFEVRDESGKRSRTAWDVEMPWIHLQPAPARLEMLVKPGDWSPASR